MPLIDFPQLTSSQVALLRVDCNTGHILDNEFKLHISKYQEMYSIFNSIDEAKEYIEENKIIYKNVEFVIYDNLNNLISIQ